MRPGNLPNQCLSSNRGKKCQKSHHTPLHRLQSTSQQTPVTASYAPLTNTTTDSAIVNQLFTSDAIRASPATIPAAEYIASSHATTNLTNDCLLSILLATACVVLQAPEGRSVKVRALLDQGSTHSFISESIAETLRTPRHRVNLDVTSFGDAYSGCSTSYVQVTLAPCNGQGVRLPLRAYVYQKITSYAATQSRKIGSWSHLTGLALADPDPSSKEPINALIGADLYGYLLIGPIRQGPIGSPTAQLTTLGWIISGPTDYVRALNATANATLHCGIASDPDVALRRFWEIEEIPVKPFRTPEEEKCESHFVRNHSRDTSGRYIVRLPFRSDTRPVLGDSHKIALSRYQQHENRLKNKPEIANAYIDFLTEYESLGHMEEVRESDASIETLYIPHHPVLRETSSTTRLRVVFNASSATSSGTSLNEHLLIGPKLQCDIGNVISSWRRYRFVYMADIEKMFRQILVHRDDTDYQRIVFRPDSNSLVRDYRLLTVTFGMACAPYLANRVLIQLTEDEGSHFPDAAEVIRNSTYVDDVLFGADDRETAQRIRSQLNSLLARGGLLLRKWAANDVELLKDIPAVGHALAIDLSTDDSAVLKVLGIAWLPKEDSFSFQVNPIAQNHCTKRTILSVIARLFDPLGWASPVIITAKILLQDLWLAKTDWDEAPPRTIRESWKSYCDELPNVSSLRFSRWINTSTSYRNIELHGFADASQRAFAAVIYVRVQTSLGQVCVSLLTAMSKVAPLKTVSIPRLELNGVSLLARLFEYVKQDHAYDSIPIRGWTDSTVALAWLTQHPSRWKPYVANRVSEIQNMMPGTLWHHVPTRDNPADCASRGIPIAEFIRHPLWWTGPSWLGQPSEFWPKPNPYDSPNDQADSHIVVNEQRATVHTALKLEEWDLPFRFSSWGKLLRITSVLFHWLRKFRARKRNGSTVPSAQSAEGIRHARDFWIRHIQSLHFHAEIITLQSNTPLHRASSLKTLTPFLDRNDHLRLGGRLRHSYLSYDERFPRILPRHHISELIIDQTHLRSLHGGTQLTLCLLRQEYWILGARSLVKSRINRCLICVRERSVTATQLMGDLPSPRVTPSPPFIHCGVDNAGPFQIIPYVGRGQRSRKYYVALFVCLTTRAIHLEYVDDYATSGFLAAFQRFTSRRGLPTDMYSDNGTNFQGADNELRRKFIATQKSTELREKTVNEGIRWHFIPASAPHFGGLWEAGVKSFKHHLRRVVGSHTLSQLEFSTLLCRIEAALNSRSLSPLRDDPENLEVLTPGHFLIGRPLLSHPEPALLELKEPRFSRWQKVQAMHEHFWKA